MKTTSFETVAQPKFGDGSRRSHSTLARRRVERDEPAAPFDGSSSVSSWRPTRCPTRTGRRPARRDGRPRRPSASRRRRAGPGRRSPARRGSGPTSLRCSPTTAVQRRRRVSRSQAITRPAFPAPNTRSTPVERRENRRRLEVVVPNVVRSHLVVPEQPPCRARRARAASRCTAPGPGKRRRSAAPAYRPRAPGSSCPRRAVRRGSTETGIPGPPPPASSGYRHGSLTVTNFHRTAPVCGVERVDRASARTADSRWCSGRRGPFHTTGAMSMNCSLAARQVRRQRSRPVAASSPKASVSVAP